MRDWDFGGTCVFNFPFNVIFDDDLRLLGCGEGWLECTFGLNWPKSRGKISWVSWGVGMGLASPLVSWSSLTYGPPESSHDPTGPGNGNLSLAGV